MYHPFGISEEEKRKRLDEITKAHEKELAEANAEANDLKSAREKAREERKNTPALESKTSLANRKNGKIIYSDGTEEILYYDDGIREITKWQFGTNVAEVSLPTSVEAIGFSAFDDCKNLTAVEIPESVTEIGAFAFSRCYALTHVTIPASVTKIENSAFAYCDSLETVEILGDPKIDTKAFSYNAKLKNISMPNISALGMSVFSYCLSIESIALPQGLKKLDYSNFYRCPELKIATIPAAIEEIEDDCFNACDKLTEVNISVGDGVTAIAKEDFCWCPAMAWKPPVPGRTKMGKRSFPKIETVGLIIPTSITEIGDGALEYIPNLKSIYYAGTKEDFAKIKIGKNNPKINGLFGKVKIIYKSK